MNAEIGLVCERRELGADEAGLLQSNDGMQARCVWS